MVHVAQSLGDFRTPVGAFGNRGGSGSNPRCTAAVGSLPRAAFIGSALGRTEDPPTDPLARLKNALGVNVTPGVLGRFMAVLWLHPLDTLRTRAQVVAFSSKRTVTTAVYRSPGSTAGLGPALAGQVPSAILTCLGYEFSKGYLEQETDLDPRLGTVAAAVLGDLFGHFWSCPAEVLKTTLQTRVQSSRAAAVRGLLAAGPAGLFKGYRAMVLRDVPFRVLQVGAPSHPALHHPPRRRQTRPRRPARPRARAPARANPPPPGPASAV